MMLKQTLLAACVGFVCLSASAQTAKTVRNLSLAGRWSVTLGTDTNERTAVLPGTIDTNRLGQMPRDTTETTHLTRLSSYRGRATYQRLVDIPRQWKRGRVLLFLERTKPTWVYVDGQLVDSCNYISTPHRYLLPRLKPGRHELKIVVDNSRGVPHQIYASSHAYTEDTQTNWNGIIGEMRLEYLDVSSSDELAHRAPASLPSASQTYMGNTLPCFQNFHIEGAHFCANGHKIFLRGKHDAAVWPLTGHVDMTVAGWMKYLSTCREYGINHVRFHSWCPPEAAFVAADSLGIYLQPELPFWGSFDENDSLLMTFLHREGENILREYGHHPSFRMMALGNELWGSVSKMKAFVDDYRRIAPDKFYTFGSNYYLGYQGVKEGMDYFTTCRIGGEQWGTYSTHTRGSFSFADAFDGGMINHFRPNTARNFDEACNRWASPQPWQDAAGKAGVPIISHETGQFQTYPDYREIRKYTGVLYPYNLEIFRRRLAAAGMLDRAGDFHRASGAWSVRLYKADIEMDLRTRNMAGFQLLDIQDYPGQGSAYVGILDAFMESKGLVSPQTWREWCAPIVPLLVTDSLCYASGDTLRGKIQIANYGASSLRGRVLNWRLGSADPSWTELTGRIRIDSAEEGLIDVGRMNQVLRTDKPLKLQLTLAVEGTEARNGYELWVYPVRPIDKHGVIVTRTLSQRVVEQLNKGARVLWMPDSLTYTVGGLFQTDYWNYRMFKTICENNKKAVSPGTLGLMTNPEHPLFRDFPTEMHTNWQWFPVVKNGRALVLDNFPAAYNPIVQVIDNVERNHKLGLVMEWTVGKGRLLVCMSDLEKAAIHPEGRAFYVSVLNYMRSAEFRPQASISASDLLKTLSTAPHKTDLKELNNISQY